MQDRRSSFGYTPKPSLLMNSTNGDELIAAGVCVCCRSDHSRPPDVLCAECRSYFSCVDYSAFAGMLEEVRRKLHPGQP